MFAFGDSKSKISHFSYFSCLVEKYQSAHLLILSVEKPEAFTVQIIISRRLILCLCEILNKQVLGEQHRHKVSIVVNTSEAKRKKVHVILFIYFYLFIFLLFCLGFQPVFKHVFKLQPCVYPGFTFYEQFLSEKWKIFRQCLDNCSSNNG